jgi:hypothetical protein
MKNLEYNPDGNSINVKKIIMCDCCNKEFRNRTGLWKHKKKCNAKFKLELHGRDEIIHLLQTQNKELMDLLKSGIIHNASTINNTNNTNNTNNNTTNTNSHNVSNKTFNLNVFLNETCKDAMNISDFVSSIQVDLDELENTGRRGYIEGISDIIINRLNNLEQHFRPLHCSDSKREIFYIKDKNEWLKENNDRPILTKAIKTIANENMKQINAWRQLYPDCTKADSMKNDLYLKIVSNSMNGFTKEEGDRNIDKIIKNISKKVLIDKSK